MAGLKAFRESYLTMSDGDGAYIDYDARVMRYALLWAMYENTAYRAVHRWSPKYKSDYGLYQYTRGIYNPSFRLGEFWKTHLLGGKLDPLAGDGSNVTSALPIVTENEALRTAIAQVWRNSNWQVKKGVFSLHGAVLGDAVIKIVDDTARRKVYMSVVHPSTIQELDLDTWGNVKGYIIQESRPDPRGGGANTTVTYEEKASRDGDAVVYETFLNGQPYSWDGDGLTTWRELYGFIPMVLVQQNNVGLDFGMSELTPGLAKFREVDDLASKLSDQVRKMVDSPWLFSGVKAGDVSVTKPDDDTEKPEKGRESMPAIFGPVGADAKPLVSNLDIAATAAYIKDILADIEQDYPELSADIHNVQGDISGRALRINRAPAEDKVLERRPNYDDAQVRALQMAIAIGGQRKYDGFSGFGLESYKAGNLEFSIGDRPVFAPDPMDGLEQEGLFWTNANQAKTFGIPPLAYLKSKGWSDEQIADVQESPEYAARMAALEASALAMNEGTTRPGRTAQADTVEDEI